MATSAKRPNVPAEQVQKLADAWRGGGTTLAAALKQVGTEQETILLGSISRKMVANLDSAYGGVAAACREVIRWVTECNPKVEKSVLAQMTATEIWEAGGLDKPCHKDGLGWEVKKWRSVSISLRRAADEAWGERTPKTRATVGSTPAPAAEPVEPMTSEEAVQNAGNLLETFSDEELASLVAFLSDELVERLESALADRSASK